MHFTNQHLCRRLAYCMVAFAALAGPAFATQELPDGGEVRGGGQALISWEANVTIFPEEWAKEPFCAAVKPIERSQRTRAHALVNRAIQKYPESLIKETLLRVFVVGELAFFNQQLFSGTTSDRAVYLVVKPEKAGYTDHFIEATFHREYSSLLLNRYLKHLDQASWKAINPEGFRYLGASSWERLKGKDGGAKAIESGTTSLSLQRRNEYLDFGFLTEYSRSSIENDFNEYAAALFMNASGLRELAENHPAVAKKRDLAIQFYSSIAPKLNAMITTLRAGSVEPFEMIIIPDSQRYTQAFNHGAPELFAMQTAWISDKAVAENIVFVTHVGDVIQDDIGLWASAGIVMGALDGVVPYGVTFGNHDGGAPNVFAASRYQGYSWYLGASSDRMAHAQTFNGGGIDFLHINLPHNASAAHRTWAQGIITAHPGKPTIITTHGYMADNAWGRDANGDHVWNDLVNPNPQVFMTVNGHDWVSRHETGTTGDGRKIIQIQSNWQQIINGGNALLQKVIFDPDNSQIRVKTYSPFLDLHHTDWTGEFTYAATFGASSVTVNNEVGPTHRIWKGGSDDNWQTAANWDGGAAPVAGDILRFKNVSNKTSANNFPAGTRFAGMVFEPGKFSNGFIFSGNAITLAGDIVNMGGYGPDTPGTGPIINLPITLAGDRQINTGDWDITMGGVISGSGSLTKTHGRDYFRGSYDGGVHIGDLYLTGINTYTGETKVTGGALILKNTGSSNPIASSSAISLYYNAVLKVDGLQNGTLVLASGQTLSGTGKVAGKTAAVSGSVIAPGLADPGALLLLNNLALNSGSALDIRMGDLAVGAYDQVDVTGTVGISGATLNLMQYGRYVPQIGDAYVIVQNDGTELPTGRFVSGVGSDLTPGSALPEGIAISSDFLGSGLAARISYHSGDGNDVSITICSPQGQGVTPRLPQAQ